MLDNLTAHNHTDFKQRYQGTFGFLVQEGKKHLVYLSYVDHKVAKFQDVAKTEYYVYAGGEHQFEFIQVQRGWFNTKTGLYYLTRVPQRQWHRGICTGNTEMYYMADSICRQDLTIKSLAAVFEQEITAMEAYQLFRDKNRNGVALSKHFALSYDSIYFDNKIVGKVVVGSEITITLSTNLVHQEINDTIRRCGYQGIVLLRAKE